MVSTVIGARRSGKSYRILQAADELLRQGMIPSLRHICHLDFDNALLMDMKAGDLNLIQTTFLKITPEADLRTPIVFLFDEIHRIAGWEAFVIELSRNPNWKVLVTGSSSRLLRDEIATELRGKAISTTVLPLSFREFLRFQDVEVRPASTTGQAEATRLFEQYLKWGGFPAMARLEEFSREALLREYFDTMILRDIIERYNVSRPQHCLKLYHYLLSNIGKPVTLASAYAWLKQCGFATSRDAVRDYIEWAADAWLLWMVPTHSTSHKEQERNYKKVYAIDWALALYNSMVWDGSYSRALENMVYLHLRRRFQRIHYVLTRSRRQEVDFLTLDDHGNPALAVQVCSDISDPSVLEREMTPLVAAARYYGVKESLIVTLTREELFQEEGVTVRAVPAWKWMLE
ncbi:MAG: ATP-binding protein [bacterium]